MRNNRMMVNGGRLVLSAAAILPAAIGMGSINEAISIASGVGRMSKPGAAMGVVVSGLGGMTLGFLAVECVNQGIDFLEETFKDKGHHNKK